MAHVFAVQGDDDGGTPAKGGSRAKEKLFFGMGPIVVSILIAKIYESTSLSWETYAVALLSFTAAAFLIEKVLGRNAAMDEITVTVLPLGAQLETRRCGALVAPPLLIPCEDILDVIVNEVILAHKVLTVVMFRVLASQKNCSSSQGSERDARHQSIESLLKEGRIQLIPAFPGVEMSYVECQSMRRGISQSLGLE